MTCANNSRESNVLACREFASRYPGKTTGKKIAHARQKNEHRPGTPSSRITNGKTFYSQTISGPPEENDVKTTRRRETVTIGGVCKKRQHKATGG